MPRWLKRGMDAGAIKAADAKVRETVEDILAQVDARKDAAIRELSEKFDKWSPADFKLCRMAIMSRGVEPMALSARTRSSTVAPCFKMILRAFSSFAATESCGMTCVLPCEKGAGCDTL